MRPRSTDVLAAAGGGDGSEGSPDETDSAVTSGDRSYTDLVKDRHTAGPKIHPVALDTRISALRKTVVGGGGRRRGGYRVQVRIKMYN